MTTGEATDAAAKARTAAARGGIAALAAPPVSHARWLWLGTVGAIVAICWVGAFGVGLGAIGQYRVWLVVVAAAVASVASIVPIARSTTRGATDRWAPVALIVAVVAFGWNLTNLGEHVVIDRDPGSYAATAEWLASHGDLRVQLTNQVVADVPGLRLAGPAVYPVTATTVEFQFNHAASAVFAIGSPFGGGRGIFAIPAFVGSVGLLAVYLTIRGMCRFGGVAVAAMAAMALSLPYLYVARDTYSETFVLATLWAGIALLQRLIPKPDEQSVVSYLLLGSLIGATALFRVDAGLYLITLIASCALLRLNGHTLRRVGLVLGAAALPALIGALDARILAGNYLNDLSSQIRLLTAAELGALLALVALECFRYVDRPLGRRIRGGAGNRVALGTGLAASAAFLGLWLLRPAVSKATGPWGPNAAEALHLAGVQRSLGLEIEPLRSYGEQSLMQFVWYLGLPLVIAAAIGVGVVVVRGMRQPTGPFGVFALAVAIGAPYYLWDPSITPDHLWSTRRYAPFILPAIVACAAIAIDTGATALRGRRAFRGERVSAIAAFAATAAFVLPTLWATWPMRNMAEHRNFFGALERTCDVVGPDAVIITVGFDGIAMPLRSWCGAEVMSTSVEDVQTTLAAVRDRAHATCTRVHVVSIATPDEGGFANLVAFITANHGFSFTTPEYAVGQRPDSYRGDNLNLLVSWIPLPDPCTVAN